MSHVNEAWCRKLLSRSHGRASLMVEPGQREPMTCHEHPLAPGTTHLLSQRVQSRGRVRVKISVLLQTCTTGYLPLQHLVRFLSQEACRREVATIHERPSVSAGCQVLPPLIPFNPSFWLPGIGPACGTCTVLSLLGLALAKLMARLNASWPLRPLFTMNH